MKQYKVTITNGDYPLSHTCDTIADAYECLCTFARRAPSCITLHRDEVMDLLVNMRRGGMSKHCTDVYSITVLEEADADADLD